MTVTTCPSCDSANVVELVPGEALCFDCRAEWNPNNPPERKPLPVIEPVQVHTTPATPDDVLHALDVADVLAPRAGVVTAPHAPTTPVALNDLVNGWEGRFVSVRGLKRALLVVADEGGDTIVCENDHGKETVRERSHCTLLPDVGESQPAASAQDIDAPEGALSPIILTVASLCITVGLQACGDRDTLTIYNPRIGWMPPPCDGLPEAEQGAAYAVAMLVQAFALDRGEVAILAGQLLGEVITDNESE